MQIELLDTFLDLVETNSFNRTAERLGLTQSTVSSRVKTLETTLGKRLFTRSRAGTRPTAAGLRLVEHARTLRREWNETRRSVGSVGDFERSMRIGIQPDLAAAQLGLWVSEFRKALPRTAFYVELDFSLQMSSDVLAGELDFAVLFTPKHLPDLHYESVGAVSYRMVSTHARRLSDVDAARYVFANYSPAFDKAHRRLREDLGAAPTASGQTSAVCDLLTSLGGSAFVLDASAQELVASGKCSYVEDVAPILQDVYAVVNLRHRHSRPHRKLLAIVRQHFGSVA